MPDIRYDMMVTGYDPNCGFRIRLSGDIICFSRFNSSKCGRCVLSTNMTSNDVPRGRWARDL